MKENVVNVVVIGMRNLYEYFETMFDGHFTPWWETPHDHVNITYQPFNIKVDYIWGPQMETGNQ